MACGIYKIVNPLGKVYIGQSTDITKRLAKYERLECKDQPLLYNSLSKYGFNKHTITTLCICEISELNDNERFYINEYKSNNKNFGLNLTNGGQDYFLHNDETKAKMSACQKGNTKTLGRKQTKEEIEKRIKKTTGKKRTDATRKQMSIAHIGEKHTLERRKNLSNSLKGVNAKKVQNTVTGEIFNTAYLAANKLGIKKTTLIAMLNGQNKNRTSLKYL